ncbi:hypothetical protein EU546_02855 [Candidatus Thorarchaeota archaeon]|nr:MAG: hypothetical protein EU546_02855 [Candidatus Thorarchaeota archaeon]
MPLTETLLVSALLVSALALSIFLSAYGEYREENFMAVSVIGALVVVPVLLIAAYNLLLPFVTVMDWWTFRSYRLVEVGQPDELIVVTTWPGWLIGRFAGKYWKQDADRSCLQCALGPIVVLLLATIVLILIP